MTRDGVVCGAYADTVQHVIRRQHGGGDDLANLVAACQPCNYGEASGPDPGCGPGPLSARAVMVVQVLDAYGIQTGAGRRRAIATLAGACPGVRFRSADIDAACRWRRHRGPLGRL